jgi:hypothetical protein
MRIRNCRNAGQHAALSDHVSDSVVPTSRWLLPGISVRRQSCLSSCDRAKRRDVVRVRRLGLFCGDPGDWYPLANLSFAGAAASDRVEPPLFATTLILLLK